MNQQRTDRMATPCLNYHYHRSITSSRRNTGELATPPCPFIAPSPVALILPRLLQPSRNATMPALHNNILLKHAFVRRKVALSEALSATIFSSVACLLCCSKATRSPLGRLGHTAGMLWRLRPSFVDIELHTYYTRACDRA